MKIDNRHCLTQHKRVMSFCFTDASHFLPYALSQIAFGRAFLCGKRYAQLGQ